MLALTPISPFRPRRWSGAILPDDTAVCFRILEADNRPVSAVADQVDAFAKGKIANIHADLAQAYLDVVTKLPDYAQWRDASAKTLAGIAVTNDAALRESVEAAVLRASPLPTPPAGVPFERNLELTFAPSS